jgi:hypothetical protein
MHPEFTRALLELTAGNGANDDDEQASEIAPGESAVVHRNPASGDWICTLLRSADQLDEDSQDALFEALLQVTSASRFSPRPQVGSLSPEGEVGLSLALTPWLKDPDRLDAELDRLHDSLAALLAPGAPLADVVARISDIPLAQEAAWLRV